MKRIWIIILSGILVFVLLGFVLPLCPSRSRVAPMTIELAHIKHLGLLLYTFSDNNAGKFPKSLKDISLDTFPIEIRQFRDPVSKKLSDWIYYSGYSISDPGDRILATSSLVISSDKRTRVVLFLDMSARIMKEQDFQAIAVHQLSPR